MFKYFEEKLYSYRLDETASEKFNIYFGDDPELRKSELRLPPRILTREQELIIEDTKVINCTDHLQIETNAYQHDNKERKLNHIIDGNNQSGRKILYGLILAFDTDEVRKVAALAGDIPNYHHGEASLMSSITGRGLITPGGEQLPIIVPHSNFGSRLCGGKAAAQPRYIYCTLNRKLVELLYPKSEMPLLDYNLDDDGKRAEPKFFIPILPTAALESTEVPAHGWKLKIWARDVFEVIKIVKDMILYDVTTPTSTPVTTTPTITTPVTTTPTTIKYIREPAPSRYAGSVYEWTGTFRYVHGKLYSFGRYHINGDTVIITELPLRVWTNNYLQSLREKVCPEIILGPITSNSDDISVSITVPLAPGALDRLESLGDAYCDGIEIFFNLRDRMDSCINLMNPDGSVAELTKYSEIIRCWYPYRKHMYQRRIERQLEILRLKILLLQQIINYIRNAPVLAMSGKALTAMIDTLTTAGFVKLDKKIINNSDSMSASLGKLHFIPTDELNALATGPDASYDYLIDLRDRDKSKENLNRLEQKLAGRITEHDRLNKKYKNGPFHGSEIWSDELDEIEHVIREGFKTRWMFGSNAKFTLD
jgi:DNA topoisomerase-2